MAPKFNTLIIGGGIAGFAASVGLARKGHKVTVLERSADLQTFGGTLLIPANALKVLEDYGLLGVFREVAEKWENHMIYRHDGKVLDILSNSANQKIFGYEMLNVPRQTYQLLLYEAAMREGVNVRFGARVETLADSSTRPCVNLSTGEKIEADLIIGADGIKSTVRRVVLSGKDVKLQPNSTCYQCSVSSTDMLSNPLTATLIQEGGLQSWWGPNTHLICGRKDNGLSYEASFFIHPRPENPLPEYHASSSNSQEADNSRKGDVSNVKSNVGMYEERVKAFIKMIKPEDCLLWKVAQLPNLPSWVTKNGRIVLLGDAAHAMSPHLGQGAALSIEDGGVLSHCLSRASSADEIPRAMRAYESVQKGRAENVKRLAEVSGVFKTLEEGKERERRDRGFEERLQGQGEAGKGRERTEAEKELDKVFSTEERAKI